MYRLLIVDDEKHIHDALTGRIAWNELGIGDIRAAKNGLAALDAASEFLPHIVLCDIRMPKMDGIEFATALLQSQPRVKLIFLSGFAEKDYLKSAIRLRAFRFIEKPIVLDEVRSAVADAAEAVRAEEQAQEAERGAHSIIAESTPLLIWHIVVDLLRPDADRTAAAGRLARLGCPLPGAGPVLTVSLRLVWDEFVDESEKGEIRQALLAWLNRDCGKNGVIAGYTSPDTLALLLRAASPEAAEAMAPYEGLLKSIETQLHAGMQTLAGVGAVAMGLDELPAAQQAAESACRLLFYRRQGNVRFAGGPQGREFALGPEFYAAITDAARKGETAAAKALVDQAAALAYQCEDPEIDRVKNAFFLMMLAMMEHNRGSHLRHLLGKSDRTSIWARLERVDSLRELADYTADFLAAPGTEDSNSRVLEAIQAYIAENYMRSDLTMESVVRNVHFSQSYICSVFKKAVGKTLNEYTTEVRIARAKELLRAGNVKLYVVARQTGFNDANYFSTIFKRMTGMTPSEYREGK